VRRIEVGGDWGAVVRTLADVGRVFGLSLLLPTLVAIFDREMGLAIAFGGASTVVLLVAIWGRRLGRRDVDNWHATLALTLAWPLFSIISSLPFVVGGVPGLDALYEGVSAWTDTGLTMIQDPSTLPASLATFRILIQWFSGLGIAMFMLLLRASSPRVARTLFEAEGRPEDFSTNTWQIGRTVVRIYALYTLAGAVALWLTGLPPMSALAHAVTSLSTGGFSTNSVGVGLYGALPSVVAMVLMVAGGISFTAHRSLLQGRFREFFTNPEIRVLFAVIAGATVLVMVGFGAAGEDVVASAVPGVFYVITSITTCGAGTTLALSSVPESVRFIVLMLMVSGAVYGSTTGALKLWRLIIVGKVVGREVRRPFLPAAAVVPIRIGGTVISESLAAAVTGYVILYVVMGLAGGLIFMIADYQPIDALFTVFSAQGNVGLNAMPDALYFGMPPGLKWLLILHMLVGRVEILPLLSMLHGLRE